MTVAITTWLGFVLASAALAYFAAPRLLVVGALLASALAAYAIAPLPLSYPSPDLPAGKYTLIGARIDVNEAIYVLLDDGKGAPRYFVLPFSSGKANALQDALNAAADGQGGVQLEVGEDGEAAFHEAPVVEDAPKQAETPLMEVM